MGYVHMNHERTIFRVTVATILALAMLAPASQSIASGERDYSGALDESGKITFRARGGERAEVDRIRIEKIAMDCGVGHGELDFAIFGGAPILDDRTFSVKAEDGTGGKATVEGKFSRRMKRVNGNTRVRGRFSNGAKGTTRCDSGPQSFIAR